MKTVKKITKTKIKLYLWMMVGTIIFPSLALAQSCVEPPSGMVGWWPFDEGQPDDAFDISDLDNHGKHVGGPTPLGIGKVDQALSFDGIDDYVEVPSSPSLNVGTGDFSIDAWVRIADPADALGRVTLVDKREDTPATRGYWFFLEDGQLGVQLADGLVTNNYTTTDAQANVTADNTWHLVAVTVDRDAPDGIRFFLDDKQVGETFDPGNSSGSLDNNAPLRVASRSSSASALFIGDMDEVEIFNRDLQATEVAAIYQAGSSGKCKDQYCCIIKDSDFHSADWMAIPLLVTNPMNAGYFETQGTFGGNPCNYLHMVHSLPPSKGPDFLDQTQVWVFYKYLRESVDPATSMILSIDYREDQTMINTLPPDVNMPESRPALVQNGKIYIGRQGLNFTNTQWQSETLKYLKETDFVEIGTFFALLNNGQALPDLPMSDDPYPDFSCSGSRIHFGFCRATRRDDSNTVFTYQIEHGIDNWQVGVRCGPCGCEPGAICGMKFEDLNGNGIKDTGDSGLSGWQIALLDEEGQIVADTVTDAHGDYCFRDLLPGTYMVEEEQREGWIQTYPPMVTHIVELSYGQSVAEIDFGNRDVGEPPSECSTNELIISTGWNHETMALDPIGELTSLWRVIEDPDDDTTEPRSAGVISPNSAWDTISGSEWISGYSTSEISLNQTIVFETCFCLSGDESGELGNVRLIMEILADDEADILINNNHLKPLATTPKNAYHIQDVTFIDADISQDVNEGLNCLQVVLRNTNNVALGFDAAGKIVADWVGLEDWICCAHIGSLSGRKYSDDNGNGVRDSNEPYLSGWTINLTGGGLDKSTITDGLGFYYFNDLPAGTYTISEESQSGWVQTAPTSGAYTITLENGQAISKLDFGNREDPNSLPCEEINISQCEAGVEDGFGFENDVAELPPTPSPEVLDLLINRGCNENLEFDISQGCFAHTFTSDCWPEECNIVDANLTIGLKAAEWGGSDDDRLEIYSGTPPTLVESISISSWNNPNNTWQYPDELVHVLNLGSAVLDKMEIGEDLHILVADATWVDFVTLEVRSCCSEPCSGAICGMKFHDINGNGIKEESELGIPEWAIFVIGPNYEETYYTDENGNYCITGLAPGVYTVWEEQREGWIQTFPEAGVYTVEVPCNQTVTDIDFGNK